MLVFGGIHFRPFVWGYVISSPFIAGFWAHLGGILPFCFSKNKQSIFELIQVVVPRFCIQISRTKTPAKASCAGCGAPPSRSFSKKLGNAHRKMSLRPKEKCDESNLLITVLLVFISTLYKYLLSSWDFSGSFLATLLRAKVCKGNSWLSYLRALDSRCLETRSPWRNFPRKSWRSPHETNKIKGKGRSSPKHVRTFALVFTFQEGTWSWFWNCYPPSKKKWEANDGSNV